MTGLNRRALLDCAAMLDDTATLLRDNYRAILDRAHNDRYSGYPPTNSGEHGAGPADPTASAALHLRPDAVAKSAQALTAALPEAWWAAETIQLHTRLLLAIPAETAGQLATSSAYCSNCNRPVARTRTDRLRAGRCTACYHYHRDNHTERPRELWDDPHPEPIEALG